VSGVVVDRYTAWNQAGGEAAFSKVVDNLGGSSATPEMKRDLLVAISQATGGGLKPSDEKKKVTLAVLGDTKIDFKANAAHLREALNKEIADPKLAERVFNVLAYGHEKMLWEQERDRLKEAKAPEKDWPKEPPQPPNSDYRNWYMIWMIPSVGVLGSLVLFVLFFHLKPEARTGPDTSHFEPSAGETHKEGILPHRDALSSEEPGMG
jgi:hypothetical protein